MGRIEFVAGVLGKTEGQQVLIAGETQHHVLSTYITGALAARTFFPVSILAA